MSSPPVASPDVKKQRIQWCSPLRDSECNYDGSVVGTSEPPTPIGVHSSPSPQRLWPLGQQQPWSPYPVGSPFVDLRSPLGPRLGEPMFNAQQPQQRQPFASPPLSPGFGGPSTPWAHGTPGGSTPLAQFRTPLKAQFMVGPRTPMASLTEGRVVRAQLTPRVMLGFQVGPQTPLGDPPCTPTDTPKSHYWPHGSQTPLGDPPCSPFDAPKSHYCPHGPQTPPGDPPSTPTASPKSCSPPPSTIGAVSRWFPVTPDALRPRARATDTASSSSTLPFEVKPTLTKTAFGVKAATPNGPGPMELGGNTSF